MEYKRSVSCSVMSNSLWGHNWRPPGSPVHRIFQARILEWVAIPFSKGSSWPRDRTWVSYIAGRGLTIWDSREDPNRICTVLSAMLCLDSLLLHGLQPGSSVQGDSPDKNTGVGCHALLQGIFPTQGSNPSFSHCRRILFHLSHQRS